MALTTMYAAQTNSPTTTLASAAGAADTSLIVTSAAVLPSTVPFELSLGIGQAAAETVLVTAVNGNTLTVTRGWDGTPQAWAANTICARTFSARDLNDMQGNILALQSDMAAMVDSGLTEQGKAADAAVTGTALYRSKVRADNNPAGLTYWKFTVNYNNGFTPADMPPNSFTEATGDKLNGFGSFTFSSTTTYLIWCWLNSTNTAIRNYMIMSRAKKMFIFGRSINSGSSVSWTDWTLPAIDATPTAGSDNLITSGGVAAAIPAVDTSLSNSGEAADAATVGAALYKNKVRDDNRPAGFTWWRVNALFDAENPASPSDMPINSYCYALGSWISGFNNSVFTLGNNTAYFVWCWASLYSTSIRFYQISNPTGSRYYVGRSMDGGATVSWGNRSPQAVKSPKIMFLGDSITRGRIGGQQANANMPIPNHVAQELGITCENFGIGNIGWCAGYGTDTSWAREKDNAIGYLRRVGNPDFYNPDDPYYGYKFLGSGDWSDFNAIVIALGTNDVNYPLGSLEDIDDTLTYAEVMAWKTSAKDNSSANRTIVKAMYQVYRYIRESEEQHAEGDTYVAGGSKMHIILCDPLVTQGGSTGAPPDWVYDHTLGGGYTRRQMNSLYAAFAEKYGLGHISTYDAPLNRVKLSNSLPDGVHPNEATYEVLGRYYAAKIGGLIL